MSGKLSAKNAWRRKRAFILTRDNYTCQYCFKRLAATQLHLDHVIPKSAGGTYASTNLVASCQKCQLAKDDTPIGQLGLTPGHLQQLTPEWLHHKGTKVRKEKLFAPIRAGVYYASGQPMRSARGC